MGPADQSRAEEFNGNLVYTSEPLPEPLELIGDVSVTLYAATSTRDADWAARLCEVFPDGRSINLQEGIVRARYRESLSEPSLVEPDRVYRYRDPARAGRGAHRGRQPAAADASPAATFRSGTATSTPAATSSRRGRAPPWWRRRRSSMTRLTPRT